MCLNLEVCFSYHFNSLATDFLTLRRGKSKLTITVLTVMSHFLKCLLCDHFQNCCNSAMFNHSQVWMNEIWLLRLRIRTLQSVIWKHLSLCPPPSLGEGGGVGLFHVISVGHCRDVIASPNTPVRSWGCGMWRGLVAKKLQNSENSWLSVEFVQNLWKKFLLVIFKSSWYRSRSSFS